MLSPKSLITSLTVVVSLAILPASAAAMAARYVPQDKRVVATAATVTDPGVYSRADKQMVPTVASNPQPTVRVSTPTGGLSPLDYVGIGLGALGLALLALGSTTAITRNRGRRPHRPAAATH